MVSPVFSQIRIVSSCLFILLFSTPGWCISPSGPMDSMIESMDRIKNEQTVKALKFESEVDLFVPDEVDVSESDMYKDVDDSRPRPGNVVQVYMGDRMIIQRKGYYSDCVVPHFSADKNHIGGWTSIIKAEVPACKHKPSDKKYRVSYPNYVGMNKATNKATVLKKNKNGTYKYCVDWGVCKDNLTDNDLYQGPAFISINGSLQRTIEYAGKKGNEIKFIYSEYKDGMARDAFTREFQIDLADGSVAAYKGAVFEIVDVNNAIITYKVIRHMK